MAPGVELRLSNVGQLELLRGAKERGVALRTTVRGVSMTPFVRDRDVVTVAPLNGHTLTCGDIVAVALRAPERLVVHRLVARRRGGWLVRGDNCLRADGVVGRSDILGRVVRVERDGREVGLGVRGGAIAVGLAAFSRSGGLAHSRAFAGRARRGAAAMVRGVQGLPAYRAAGRRLAPRVTIVAASDAGEPQVSTWVARRGDVPVGSALVVARPADDGPWSGHWLHSMAVRAPYRGLGVGEALTREAIEGARRGGASALLLTVQEDNGRAVALYRKVGFERVVLLELEATLAAEKERLGRRRIVMRLGLAPEP